MLHIFSFSKEQIPVSYNIYSSSTVQWNQFSLFEKELKVSITPLCGYTESSAKDKWFAVDRR